MKKVGIVVLMCFLFLMMVFPQAGLAKVTVVDEGDFFTDEERNDLESQYVNTEFDYYVLTVDGLGGGSIDSVAESTLDEMRGEGYDAVILIDVALSEIYVEITRGTTIDQRLTTPIESLIDDTFLVAAADGRYGDGIADLITELERLGAIEPEEEEQSTEAVPPPANEGGTNSGATSSTNEGMSGALVLLVLFFGIVAFCLFFLFLDKRFLKKKFKEVHGRQQALLSTLLEPYNLSQEREGMSRGKTQELFHAKKQQLLMLLTRVKEREQELTSLLQRFTKAYVAAFSKKQVVQGKKKVLYIKHQLSQFEEATANDEASIDRLIIQLNELMEKELETTKKLSVFKERLNESIAQADALRESTGHTFTMLKDDEKRVVEALGRAVALDEAFDFAAAHEKLASIEGDLQAVEKAVQTLKTYLTKDESLLEEINVTAKKMASFVEKERLRLTEDDPFSLIDGAKEELAQFKKWYALGEVGAAEKSVQTIETYLVDGMGRLERLVTYRDQTMENIQMLGSSIEMYQQLDETFEQELKTLRAHYTSNHWGHLPDRFHTLNESVSTIETRLKGIEEDVKESVQKYKTAYEKMEKMLELFENVKELYEECFGTFAQLQEQKDRLLETVSSIDNRYAQLRTDSQREALPFDLHVFTMRRQELHYLQDHLEGQPVNLETASIGISKEQRELDEVEREIQRLLNEKRKVEREFQDLHASFGSADRRTKFRLSLSNYRSRYQACAKQIKHHLDRGQYEQALSEIGIGRRIVQEMREEERRLAQQEQLRRMAQMSQNNSSPFGGGGGSSRGGGSGFGSGSRGGGSSFGSRGGGGGFGSRGGGRKF